MSLGISEEMIQIVGLRALAVGVIGSFLPMGLGKGRNMP